ncbi:MULTISPECIES: preprotein translocase subunit YajC [unclassified Legionella]|uniref:preprotein translocase subunit YajC n=1 Tax=unclassified Legionella TaxID=2622702 RepID=UPI001055534E|nr:MULTISPECIES: preprotein translocase subunit YajC [unclassified Legionella]MDI9817598.1 preprotein translocase subunit YajC [Legionella sp. PL877]
MSFFITDALAAAPTTQAAPTDGTFMLFMLVAMFAFFYFMIIRPQSRRTKEHREMLGKLKKGDEIITSGGILAKVVRLDEQYIKIALAEGVEVNLQRSSVSAVLPKGTLKSL